MKTITLMKSDNDHSNCDGYACYKCNSDDCGCPLPSKDNNQGCLLKKSTCPGQNIIEVNK